MGQSKAFAEGDKLIHETGRYSEFVRYDNDYVWVRIDGVETPVEVKLFYEKFKAIEE